MPEKLDMIGKNFLDVYSPRECMWIYPTKPGVGVILYCF